MDSLPFTLFTTTVSGLVSATVLTKSAWATAHHLRLLIQIAVSVFVVGTAIYLALSMEYDERSKRWAYLSAGAILGFWLNAMTNQPATY